MGKKKKVVLKKQMIFNVISIIMVLSIGFYYLGRLIYYKIDSEKEIVYSDLLAKRLIEEDYSNIYNNERELSYVNGIYRYVGDVEYNHVKYKGFLWRVVRINEDNSVTLITEDSISSLSYSGSLQNYILAWLNEKKEKNTGIFEKSLETKQNELLNTKMCNDVFSELELAGCFEPNSELKIGILSVYDYLEANANESYLNNGTRFWTSNSSDETNAWFVAEDGRLSFDSYTNKYGIRPVITISGDKKILDGNGTADSPYILEDKKVSTLENAYVGSYLTFNDSLWKIVSKEEEKIKIVSEECIKDENGECISKYYSRYSNEIDIDGEELIDYLNHEYYQSIKQKEFMVTGKFYTGTYSLTENNYRTCFDYTHQLSVGFLSAAEIFAYEMPNTFLMTTSPNNNLSIYSVSENYGLYENMVTEELNIRPAIYLKASISIESGDGTYLAPYQLGGTK